MVLAHVLSQSHHAKMFCVRRLSNPELEVLSAFQHCCRTVQIVHVLTVVKFKYIFHASSSTDNRAELIG